nr:glycoside hydrolase family 11 protein [Allopontixanthobacter sediminis]
MTIRTAALACAPLLLLASCANVASMSGAGVIEANTICTNRTGEQGGYFYTFWKSSGDACMGLGDAGHYTSTYRLGPGENLVLGKGWRVGSPARTVTYQARVFEAGTNSYLTLYGWSVDPLVEYYVVDDWGSNFTPPGSGAKPLGTVESDGGTYRIYHTTRVRQPSIRGTATFAQFWSVRTNRRLHGEVATITFSNHVEGWRRAGMELGTMDYQVMATEGFGSTGNSDITVWEQPSTAPDSAAPRLD